MSTEDSSGKSGAGDSMITGGSSILESIGPSGLRARLINMLARDLLGPNGGPEEEVADTHVSERYLVGALAPRHVRVVAEQMDAVAAEMAGNDGGSDDGGGDEGDRVFSTLFPSSIGMSFCVSPEVTALRVNAHWGWYRRQSSAEENEEGTRPPRVWKRTPVNVSVEVGLEGAGILGPISLSPEQPEVVLRGVVRRAVDEVVVSLFLVNGQREPEKNRDEAWLFQPELTIQGSEGGAVFRRRPESSSETSPEARAISMRHRDRVEFAVGHGVGVHAEVDNADQRQAIQLSTRVIPAFEVPLAGPPTAKDHPALADLMLDMKELAECPASELRKALSPLLVAYEGWIESQRKRVGGEDESLRGHETEAASTLDDCGKALERIGRGIALLESKPMAADAFAFANRAMALQRVHTILAERRRRGEEVDLEEVDLPRNRSWRAFQLAFILLNLEGVTDLKSPERDICDLLWFPTGGGKTEAYLGLAAYVFALRRLSGTVEGRSGEHGIGVLMRYTLRLLTLQQFQRAAALICACEVIRREAEAAGKPIWGQEPFRIGLWVGAHTTPNRTDHSEEALKRERDIAGQRSWSQGGRGSPVQLKHCPWCGAAIDPGRNMRVDRHASGAGRTLVHCSDRLGMCPFSPRQSPREGIPVLVVDEEVYRRPPALLISTVDKFAQMPWQGRVQMLFGRVDGRCPRHGFTSPDMTCTAHPRRKGLPATQVESVNWLRPPDLIIQDELHLISGPLGTLTGLYETAVDELCSWEVDGAKVKPKVVASTATVRRAREQIHALFTRKNAIFPPPGLDASDSFFSIERDTAEAPGRLYLGICAPGRRLKVALIRTYAALLGAGARLYEEHGRHADPWMTLVGYFNALRELAGMRRLVDDDVRSRLRRREMAARGLAPRLLRMVEELTSRLASTQIPTLLDWLEEGFDPAEDERRRTARREKKRAARSPLDVLLATNMISVGVDVSRLGLMVVAGQPKTTAEYIQATSRVGRAHPGLVVTVYNWARPRDLSHYESFEHYHSCFHRHVEALSVTPFALRAVDRGLSGVLVSLVRLTAERFNANAGAGEIEDTDEIVRQALATIFERAKVVEASNSRAEDIRQLARRRVDDWLALTRRREGDPLLTYRTERDGTSRGLLEPATGGPWTAFTCLNSLRDVEPTASLLLQDGGLDEDARAFTGDRHE